MSFNKRVAFYNLGCKVNQYETDAMEEILEKAEEKGEPPFLVLLDNVDVPRKSWRK